MKKSENLRSVRNMALDMRNPKHPGSLFFDDLFQQFKIKVKNDLFRISPLAEEAGLYF
jgi:hypothetical protein